MRALTSCESQKGKLNTFWSVKGNIDNQCKKVSYQNFKEALHYTCVNKAASLSEEQGHPDKRKHPDPMIEMVSACIGRNLASEEWAISIHKGWLIKLDGKQLHSWQHRRLYRKLHVHVTCTPVNTFDYHFPQGCHVGPLIKAQQLLCTINACNISRASVHVWPKTFPYFSWP